MMPPLTLWTASWADNGMQGYSVYKKLNKNSQGHFILCCAGGCPFFMQNLRKGKVYEIKRNGKTDAVPDGRK